MIGSDGQFLIGFNIRLNIQRPLIVSLALVARSPGRFRNFETRTGVHSLASQPGMGRLATYTGIHASHWDDATAAGSCAFVTSPAHLGSHGVGDGLESGSTEPLSYSCLRDSNTGSVEICQAAAAPAATLRRNHASRRKAPNIRERLLPWLSSSRDHSKAEHPGSPCM